MTEVTTVTETADKVNKAMEATERALAAAFKKYKAGRFGEEVGAFVHTLIKAGFVIAPKPPKVKKKKHLSRADRWTAAASSAVSALEDLRAVQEEFESWKDNLPDNLQSSALADKLEEVCNIDIEGALSAAQEAEGADLPLGFGRD